MEIEIYPSKFDLKTYPATKEQSTGGGSGGGGDEHNKGWYATPEQLPATGENGDYAIVGSTDTVWVWDGDTNKWVDTDTKGQVTSVNTKTGDVVLNAENILTTENIVLVGNAGTSLEAAVATIAQTTADNTTAVGNANRRTQFIESTTDTHTTTIGGILDVINNDSTADVRINGNSIFTTISDKYQPKVFKIGETDVTVEGLLVEQKSALDQTYIETSNNGIVIKGQVVIPQLVSNLVTTFGTEPSDNKYPSEKLIYTSLGQVDQRITGVENDVNTLSTSKASQVDLTALQNKVANITTNNNVTSVAGTLNVTAPDGTTAEISTGDKGTITTGSLTAAEELETKTLVLSGTQAVKIDTFDTSITASSEDTGIPTSKAVYNSLYNVDSAKANKDATNLSTPELINAWKEKLEIDVIEASLDTYQTKSNLVTSLSSTSTDVQYPSAKSVYTAISALQNKVTSTVEVNVAPTTAQTATAITGALAKPARVVVVPKYTNIGAIYVKETNTYSATNPIYPDPVNNAYEFTNMQNVKVFVDSLGDSVDLIIEYRG